MGLANRSLLQEVAPPFVCKQSQVLETGSLSVISNSVEAMNSVLNAFWKTASKGMPVLMTVCVFSLKHCGLQKMKTC